MGRGVSSGGGQSSLGYLFGGDEPAKPAPSRAQPAPSRAQHAQNAQNAQNAAPTISEPPKPSKPQENGPEIPAGMNGPNTNNYFRAEGQNCGNFITDRPSTKVHAAPGGGSSLGYLFGAPPKK